MLIQAAVAGQGVALAHSALAQDDLDTGRLVKTANTFAQDESASLIID